MFSKEDFETYTKLEADLNIRLEEIYGEFRALAKANKGLYCPAAKFELCDWEVQDDRLYVWYYGRYSEPDSINVPLIALWDSNWGEVLLAEIQKMREERERREAEQKAEMRARAIADEKKLYRQLKEKYG